MSLDKRKQQAIESISGDSSLTDSMDDREATTLLEWGVALAGRAVEKTLDMDDDQAASFLDSSLPNVRRLIRRINKLVGEADGLEPEEVVEMMQAISEAAAQAGVSLAVPANMLEEANRLLNCAPADRLAEIMRLAQAEAAPPAVPLKSPAPDTPKTGVPASGISTGVDPVRSGSTASASFQPETAPPEASPPEEASQKPAGGLFGRLRLFANQEEKKKDGS